MLLFILVYVYLILLWTIWSAWCLARNFVQGKRLGVPILVKYITPTNPMWMVCGNVIIALCKRSPIGNGHFTRFYAPGWASNDRHKIHMELGDVFLLVTPGGNRLYISDPDTAHDILKRRKDFLRDLKMMQMLSIYGKNVFTTDGLEWQKHRKATMIAFADNDQLVWNESLVQANIMLGSWLQSGDPVRTITDDTRILTLNVLTTTLFGALPQDLSGRKFGHDDPSSQYRVYLRRILFNVIPILVLGANRLQSWWMPARVRHAGEAVGKFREFVTRRIGEEKADMEAGKRKKHNLVASLVRACEIHHPQHKTLERFLISEDEIVSNIFVYAVAGMDTTSVTLATAIVHMAAHPEIQDWVAEEISHYASAGALMELTIETFPKLKRCMAVMLETLRLCHPVSQLIKITGDCSQTIQVGGSSITLPPQLAIQINLSSLQTHPAYWGENTMIWNPQRWIFATSTDLSSVETETLLSDMSGCYMPWAVDNHVCPGKKYSQVEFVAVIVRLFGENVVNPILNGGESMDEARFRISNIALETQSKALLNEIKHPEKVRLQWTRRV